jgi:hypothetical protein
MRMMSGMDIEGMTPYEIALTLAARTGCDPRTALRAMREGPDAIRKTIVRERLERAMGEMGVAARIGARIGD